MDEAGHDRDHRERQHEVAEELVSPLEPDSARSHVVVVPAPCPRIVRIGVGVGRSALAAAHQAQDDLQPAGRQDREPREFMQRRAVSTAGPCGGLVPGAVRPEQAHRPRHQCDARVLRQPVAVPPEAIVEHIRPALPGRDLVVPGEHDSDGKQHRAGEDHESAVPCPCGGDVMDRGTAPGLEKVLHEVHGEAGVHDCRSAPASCGLYRTRMRAVGAPRELMSGCLPCRALRSTSSGPRCRPRPGRRSRAAGGSRRRRRSGALRCRSCVRGPALRSGP